MHQTRVVLLDLYLFFFRFRETKQKKLFQTLDHRNSPCFNDLRALFRRTSLEAQDAATEKNI